MIIKADKKLIKQITFYGVIGVISAISDFLIFYFLGTSFQINEYISNVISTHCGIALSFTLNSKYNFKKTDKILRRALIFYLIGLFGLLLSSALLMLGNTLQLPINFTKFLSIFIVAAVQFIFNKFVTFGR